MLSVVPTTGPQDQATEDLVHTLRDDVLPRAVEAPAPTASVGGTTAAFIDDSEDTASRLPLFIGGVVVLSFLLLMSVFRSLAVALKAAVMNLLSIGAAYGVMALAAGGGWLGGLVGIEERHAGAGLAADDDVRRPLRTVDGLRGVPPVPGPGGVRAHRRQRRAVADGLASTARVITAAAAIMVTVFGAFVLEDAVFLKLAGLGLATAVFVDATMVRMVLVPATMELLGDRNWWLPRWLDRLLPSAPPPPPLPPAPPPPPPPPGAVPAVAGAQVRGACRRVPRPSLRHAWKSAHLVEEPVWFLNAPGG